MTEYIHFLIKKVEDQIHFLDQNEKTYIVTYRYIIQ